MKGSVLESVIDLEWEMFSGVSNVGGMAGCQTDRPTFEIMRRSQAESWSPDALESWLGDLEAAHAQGRNLMSEKYAWMMENTFPREFARVAPMLPVVDAETLALVEKIVAIHLAWKEEMEAKYPLVSGRGRPLRSAEDSPWGTSFETYLRGELKTCSPETLRRLNKHTEYLLAKGINGAEATLQRQAQAYGHSSLEDAERNLRRQVL